MIASTSAAGSSGGTVTERLRRRHLAIAGDVRCDDGQGAGERARQHHAEALAAERRRDERLRPREQARQLLLRQEAEDVDAGIRDPQPGEEQPDGERIGAADLEPRARSLVDLGPGAQQDLEALAGLLPAGEGDRVLAPRRIDAVGNEHAVRDDLVVAGQPARRRFAGALGDGDPLVDAAREETPGRDRGLHPAEVAGRVVRGDDRSRRQGEHRDARHRRHRLVEVEHLEALLLEHALDPEDGAGAEDDVRQRAVRGHDHRAPDRDHVRRRVAVAADPGVEGARELTRRVVTHHQPYLVPTRLERFGLELGVLDDGAPE